MAYDKNCRGKFNTTPVNEFLNIPKETKQILRFTLFFWTNNTFDIKGTNFIINIKK